MAEEVSPLHSARIQVDALGKDIPKGKLTFPSVEQLENKQYVVCVLQRWLEELNVIEDKLLHISELYSMIRNNLTAHQFRKKMIQAASDIKSPTEFERVFLKSHWDIHRAIYDWDEVRAVAASIIEILKLRERALERNITCMRSLMNTLRSNNVLRVMGSNTAEEPLGPSKESGYTYVEDDSKEGSEEPQTEIIGGLKL